MRNWTVIDIKIVATRAPQNDLSCFSKMQNKTPFSFNLHERYLLTFYNSHKIKPFNKLLGILFDFVSFLCFVYNLWMRYLCIEIAHFPLWLKLTEPKAGAIEMFAWSYCGNDIDTSTSRMHRFLSLVETYYCVIKLFHQLWKALKTNWFIWYGGAERMGWASQKLKY